MPSSHNIDKQHFFLHPLFCEPYHTDGTLLLINHFLSCFFSIGLSLDKIDFVELVGDCTRTPIVQGIIKQIFEKEELSRTLNASECIARGSALNSAMITPHFTV